MSGVIEGGWGFVTAAYLVSVVFLVAYTASIIMRLRAARSGAEDE